MEVRQCKNQNEFASFLLQNIGELYWFNMYKIIKEIGIKPKELTGFLINPEMIVLYIGKTHIAMEYYGSEILNDIKSENLFTVKCFDYSQDSESELTFFDKVIGIKYDSTMSRDIKITLFELNEGLIIPTNRGMDKLVELNWNFDAQDFIMGFNSGGYNVPESQFARLINCVFFDANDSGLITRRVKWMDFIPLKYENNNETNDRFSIDLPYYAKNWENDLFYKYPMPEDYKYVKLKKINGFIELFGNKNNIELQITNYIGKVKINSFYLWLFLPKRYTASWNANGKAKIKRQLSPIFSLLSQMGMLTL